jgi:dUTPase
VAFDLYARESAWVECGELCVIPCNIVVEVPEGQGLLISPRSCLFKRYGLMVLNSPGVVEYMLKRLACTVRGDRIGQAFVLPVPRIELVDVEDLAVVSRGGWGSTGS